jgi:hypothetical protein
VNLINRENINDIWYAFYDGIDFDFIKKHPSDGSDGFIFCFVDNYASSIKSYNRNSVIDNIINDSEIKDSEINNNYISIYQTNGETEMIYNSIRKNLEIREHWVSIAGISRNSKVFGF